MSTPEQIHLNSEYRLQCTPITILYIHGSQYHSYRCFSSQQLLKNLWLHKTVFENNIPGNNQNFVQLTWILHKLYIKQYCFINQNSLLAKWLKLDTKYSVHFTGIHRMFFFQIPGQTIQQSNGNRPFYIHPIPPNTSQGDNENVCSNISRIHLIIP